MPLIPSPMPQLPPRSPPCHKCVVSYWSGLRNSAQVHTAAVCLNSPAAVGSRVCAMLSCLVQRMLLLTACAGLLTSKESTVFTACLQYCRFSLMAICSITDKHSRNPLDDAWMVLCFIFSGNMALGGCGTANSCREPHQRASSGNAYAKALTTATKKLTY